MTHYGTLRAWAFIAMLVGVFGMIAAFIYWDLQANHGVRPARLRSLGTFVPWCGLAGLLRWLRQRARGERDVTPTAHAADAARRWS